jgi:hypothetical protein
MRENAHSWARLGSRFFGGGHLVYYSPSFGFVRREHRQTKSGTRTIVQVIV